MRNFDFKLFYGLITKNLIWIRILHFKHGISISRKPKLFFERYRYKKHLPLPFGWRLQILKGK